MNRKVSRQGAKVQEDGNLPTFATWRLGGRRMTFAGCIGFMVQRRVHYSLGVVTTHEPRFPDRPASAGTGQQTGWRAPHAFGVVTGLVFTLLLGSNSPARDLELQVHDEGTHQPLPLVEIAWTMGTVHSGRVQTDAQGLATIRLPEPASSPVRIVARRPSFSPMAMQWAAENVPSSFVLELPASQLLGGRILDATGQPVQGAQVALVFPESLAGARVLQHEPPLTSDPDGRWRSEVVPKDAAYVHVEVTHPDYVVQRVSASLDQLRDMSATITMQPVARVFGRVKVASGEGAAGAQLILGEEHGIWPGSGTPETTSGKDGSFQFTTPVPWGNRLLGVSADGAAPLLVAVKVSADMEPVEVTLQPGMPMRVKVQDAEGHALAGAKLTVNEWPANQGGRRWAYPGWEWSSDTEGRITWPHAPAEAAVVTVSKGGYMSAAHQAMPPSKEERVVVLGPAFEVHGTVTDAEGGGPVPEFFLNARYVRLWGAGQTNFGKWYDYQRKPFVNGAFSARYDFPLLAGTDTMHQWQFRAEAEGYTPVTSRVLDDAERGAELSFALARETVPEFDVAAPTATQRLTAGLAIQPTRVAAGDPVTLFVKARLAPGFHIYALDDSGNANRPTQLSMPRQDAVQADGPWRSPEPKVDSTGARTLEGEVLLRRRHLVPAHQRAGRQTVRLNLTFQVCNEAFCWPPETMVLAADLEVVESP